LLIISKGTKSNWTLTVTVLPASSLGTRKVDLERWEGHPVNVAPT
jgi:hypothetical protein